MKSLTSTNDTVRIPCQDCNAFEETMFWMVFKLSWEELNKPFPSYVLKIPQLWLESIVGLKASSFFHQRCLHTPKFGALPKLVEMRLNKGGGVAGEGSQLQKPIEVTIHAILESQDILFLGTNSVVLKGDCNYFETSFI